MTIEQLTIVPSDGIVIINGRTIRMEVGLHENIRAVQWEHGNGHIEYKDGSVNTYFPSLSPYKWLIKEHERLVKIEDGPKTEKEVYEELVGRRDALLAKTDWMVLRDTEERTLGIGTTLLDEELKQLLEYRQSLRELPQKHSKSKEWAWPKEPGYNRNKRK